MATGQKLREAESQPLEIFGFYVEFSQLFARFLVLLSSKSHPNEAKTLNHLIPTTTLNQLLVEGLEIAFSKLKRTRQMNATSTSLLQQPTTSSSHPPRCIVPSYLYDDTYITYI